MLHELTQIALGHRCFSVCDKSTGQLIELPPSESACMKALELLGKSMKLFSENAADDDNSLQVDINVIGGGKK